ncbi:MAG: 3'-5' exonuclease [Microcella sp.]|uniref:3'-5' exonuclease n=1 Tax=Microcella sp. TaxID=1913979 RepID=UPI0024CD3FF7|nr:3'-5' exonuclease [Microcella sp.]UYN83876.1 MAG: 3'-5' exonuclease [Microcella sp.]
MPSLRDDRVTLISVDIEAAGPSPSSYAMLSIGACLVDEPSSEAPDRFYAELRPDREAVDERAMTVGGFTLEGLRASGTEPQAAMQQFADWIESVTPEGSRAVMVGFNAAFDWMFVCDYFDRYLGRNPFGHSALDIKAYYMGVTGEPWSKTAMVHVAEHYGVTVDLTHNALDDARDQASLFRAVRAEQAARVG